MSSDDVGGFGMGSMESIHSVKGTDHESSRQKRQDDKKKKKDQQEHPFAEIEDLVELHVADEDEQKTDTFAGQHITQNTPSTDNDQDVGKKIDIVIG